MGIIWTIIIGFLAGVVAKFIMPGDNEPLYLGSSFTNFAKLGVPQVAFDGQIAAIAVTAVNLQGKVVRFETPL